MMRLIKTASLIVLIAILASYLGDALVVQVRLRHGTAYQVIQLNQLLATPLKGQKVEYDVDEQVPVTCVRSLFPQLGATPCWWVKRHAAQ
jgi:hypothetical protein